MEDQVLTIEQMKHLQELGLDTSGASMKFVKYKEDYTLLPIGIPIGNTLKERTEGTIDTYTVTDILNKLPKAIRAKDYLTDNFVITGLCIFRSMLKDMYKVCYQWESDSKNKCQNSPTFKGESLLEATYKLLCWCLENKHI